MEGGLAIMLKSKRIILLLVIIIMPLFIIGCKKIDVRSETIINKDESGQIYLYVKYDDFLKKHINGNIFNYDWAEQNGYEVKKYIKDDAISEELIYRFNNLKELEDKVNSSGLMELSHKDKIKENKKAYEFNLVVNKENIENLLLKSINTGDKTKDKMVLKYIENIMIHNDIRYCNARVKPNSAGMASKVDLWNCKLNQFEDGDIIEFYVK